MVRPLCPGLCSASHERNIANPSQPCPTLAPRGARHTHSPKAVVRLCVALLGTRLSLRVFGIRWRVDSVTNIVLETQQGPQAHDHTCTYTKLPLPLASSMLSSGCVLFRVSAERRGVAEALDCWRVAIFHIRPCLASHASNSATLHVDQDAEHHHHLHATSVHYAARSI